MEENFTDRQYLEARKKYLVRMRTDLNWTTAETAKKLKVLEAEYIPYENGTAADLGDYEWEDIKYFLKTHLDTLEGK